MSTTTETRRAGTAEPTRMEDDVGTPPRIGTAGRSAREAVAYHEAGHAAVGHSQGLTFSVIYVGDASGQVIFDDQWEREAVVRDADLLDRYGLMLLAGGHAEQRHAGGVLGAQLDVETLERMLWEADQRGTVSTADLWRRADRLVAARWPGIEALAAELLQRGARVGDPDHVPVSCPYLGSNVAETRGARAREILDDAGAPGALS